MATTPYMSLVLPDPSVTTGPGWASDLNTALSSVDSHTHAPGSGVQVPTAGININADLSLNEFNLIAPRTVRLNDNGSAVATSTDLNILHCAGGNLYYRDGSGNQIQITASGALNAASIGGIGGDYSTSTASLAYSSATKKFTFLQASLTPAIIDCGNIVVRKNTASSNGITIAPASGIAADYTLTLPAAVPGAASEVRVDTSGNLSFATPAIPAGSKMVFYQSAAPTGWTRDTSANDRFLRVVSAGSPGTTGGSFSLGSESSHTHATYIGIKDVGGTPVVASGQQASATTRSPNTNGGSTPQATGGTTANSGTIYCPDTAAGSSHTHSHTSSLHAYADVMVCTKDAY